jgi:hypothetical protein
MYLSNESLFVIVVVGIIARKARRRPPPARGTRVSSADHQQETVEPEPLSMELGLNRG